MLHYNITESTLITKLGKMRSFWYKSQNEWKLIRQLAILSSGGITGWLCQLFNKKVFSQVLG